MRNYWLEKSQKTEGFEGFNLNYTEQCWDWNQMSQSFDTIKEIIECCISVRLLNLMDVFQVTLTSPEIAVLWDTRCCGFYPDRRQDNTRVTQVNKLRETPIFKINELKDLLLMFYPGGIVTITIKNFPVF